MLRAAKNERKRELLSQLKKIKEVIEHRNWFLFLRL